MKYIRNIIVSVLVAAPLALAMPFTVAAANGSFSLTPATGSFAPGSTFTVQMRFNTGGNAITAAQGTVTFNSALLSATVSTAGTDLPLSIPSVTAGRVQIGGAVPGTTGFTGANGLLGTITFTVKASGTAAVTYDNANNNMVLTDGTTTIPVTATDGSYTLTGTTTPPTPTGPVVSQVASSSITETTAKVTWATDTSTKGKVQYGVTTSYGSEVSESAFATNHSVTLSGLSANTTYYFRVVATDQAGTSTTSAGANLKTTAQATTPTGNPSTPTGSGGTGTKTSTGGSTSTTTSSKPITAPVTGAGETVAIILAILAGIAGVVAYVVWQRKKRGHSIQTMQAPSTNTNSQDQAPPSNPQV